MKAIILMEVFRHCDRLGIYCAFPELQFITCLCSFVFPNRLFPTLPYGKDVNARYFVPFLVSYE